MDCRCRQLCSLVYRLVGELLSDGIKDLHKGESKSICEMDPGLQIDWLVAGMNGTLHSFCFLYVFTPSHSHLAKNSSISFVYTSSSLSGE